LLKLVDTRTEGSTYMDPEYGSRFHTAVPLGSITNSKKQNGEGNFRTHSTDDLHWPETQWDIGSAKDGEETRDLKAIDADKIVVTRNMTVSTNDVGRSAAERKADD
jgi:hypothetical protein